MAYRRIVPNLTRTKNDIDHECTAQKCSRCEKWLRGTEYQWDDREGSYYRHCRPCELARRHKWIAKDPERHVEYTRRSRALNSVSTIVKRKSAARRQAEQEAERASMIREQQIVRRRERSSSSSSETSD